MTDWLSRYATPFDALKTAEQDVQFGLDPSRGLTRERYQWYSNGTRFDNSHFSDGAGEIDISTSATGTDFARLHTGLAGQYVSQSLSKPGAKLFVDPTNVEFDSDSHVSLTNGKVQVGPFIHNGTSVQTGFGLEIDTSGARVFWKSAGSHQGNSPVEQADWSTDKMDEDGRSGLKYDPSAGYVLNFPYTWYNNGKLGLGLLNTVDNQISIFHEFNPPVEGDGRASLSTPNLPVQVIFDNDGDASSLTGAVGGMQYTLYGAGASSETRDTYVIEKDVSISTAAGDPVDPISTPGDMLYAVKRDPEFDTVQLSLNNIDIQPDADIYMYIWDIFSDSELTGESFGDPITNFTTEVRSQVDTDGTLDTTNAVFRKAIPIKSGGGSKISLTEADVDERIPLNAIRVVTAVGQSSSNVSANYVAKNLEGF